MVSNIQNKHLNRIKPKYVIDELPKAAGHEVVHIPPYYCYVSRKLKVTSRGIVKNLH